MTTILDRIQSIKADYDDDLSWGVRFDVANLPVGHVLPASRVWCDDEPTEQTLQGTCIIGEDDLDMLSRYGLTDEGVYIVCGYGAMRGSDAGELIVRGCEIMEIVR